jgi:drug/metabolite transporter superfamily protein YnfA
MNMKGKVDILAEFWLFLRASKKWWLGPIMIILALMSLIIVLTESSALAPFIYSLF